MLFKFSKYHFILLVVLVFAAITNITIGSVKIPLQAISDMVFGNFEGKASWEYIVINYRIPKLITCIVIGSALSVAGMLMQTLFQNPMAEPYVLGVSSGASLGVALCILAAVYYLLVCRNFLIRL